MNISSENKIKTLKDLRDLLVGGNHQFYAGWSVDAIKAIDNSTLEVNTEPFGWYYMDDPKVFTLPGGGFHSGKNKPDNALHAVPLYTDTYKLAKDVLKDAERYRWLRSNWTTMRSSSTDTTLKLYTGEKRWADFGQEVIDAAIDNAMLNTYENKTTGAK